MDHKIKKILTIIIPSYNTECYINECLPYFLDKQILNDIEIIIIDDGSKDNTALEAKKYIEKYPDTVRLVRKENGGHGSVINRGIKEANGKYFKVVDGDDWVITDNFVSFVLKLKQLEVDLIINPFVEYNIEKKVSKIISYPSGYYGEIKEIDKILNTLEQTLQLHAVTYRTSLLKSKQIVFQENCYYEDIEYVLYPLPYISTVIVYKEPIYMYRVGTQTQSMNIKNRIKNVEMMCIILTNIIHFYQAVYMEVSLIKKEYMVKFILGIVKDYFWICLHMPLGKEAKERICYINLKLKKEANEIYKKMARVPGMSLLKINTWGSYWLAHTLLKAKRRCMG